jgi:hypothetical protein
MILDVHGSTSSLRMSEDDGGVSFVLVRSASHPGQEGLSLSCGEPKTVVLRRNELFSSHTFSATGYKTPHTVSHSFSLVY